MGAEDCGGYCGECEFVSWGVESGAFVEGAADARGGAFVGVRGVVSYVSGEVSLSFPSPDEVWMGLIGVGIRERVLVRSWRRGSRISKRVWRRMLQGSILGGLRLRSIRRLKVSRSCSGQGRVMVDSCDSLFYKYMDA